MFVHEKARGRIYIRTLHKKIIIQESKCVRRRIKDYERIVSIDKYTREAVFAISRDKRKVTVVYLYRHAGVHDESASAR